MIGCGEKQRSSRSIISNHCNDSMELQPRFLSIFHEKRFLHALAPWYRLTTTKNQIKYRARSEARSTLRCKRSSARQRSVAVPRTDATLGDEQSNTQKAPTTSCSSLESHQSNLGFFGQDSFLQRKGAVHGQSKARADISSKPSLESRSRRVLRIGSYLAMQTFFGSVKKRSASSPPSRPTPLAFIPPNGTRRSRTSQQFTQTVPV